jgi:hypothetical protein
MSHDYHKYIKYKNKYLLYRLEQKGGSNIHNRILTLQTKIQHTNNIIHKYNELYNIIIKKNQKNQKNTNIVPCIELYEFEIAGYNNNNMFSFGPIYKTPSNSCGVINVLNNNNNFNSMLNSSCDPIYSNIQLGGSLNMNDYYNIYLKTLAKNDKPKENKLFTINVKNDFIKNMKTIINNNMNYINTKANKTIITNENIDDLHKSGFVFKINVPSTKKVIIIGDLHGSLHTFLRNMFRLIRLSILDMNFKLNDDYVIIFLGDILDRGFYAIEIISFICKLIIVNNTMDELKVIYNRGNHEEIGIWSMYGFNNEMNIKFPELKENNYNLITRFFTTLSSGIILSTMIDNIEHKFWLSHGGIPYCNITKKPLVLANDDILQFDEYYADHIRWCDFCTNDTTIHSIRGPDLYNVNHTSLNEFLGVNNIMFVIRGHMDSIANSYVLATNERHAHIIGLKNNISSKMILINPNNFIDNNRNAKNGPIARVLLNIKEDTIDNTQLHRVITLSTNTDTGRPLVHDSFGILRFDLTKNNVNEFSPETNIYDVKKVF